jgi:hypothetical protein
MSFFYASSPPSAHVPCPIVFVSHHDESNIPPEIRHLSTIVTARFDISDIIALTADATRAQFHPLWYGQLVRFLVLDLYDAVLFFPWWTADPDRNLYSPVTHPNVRFDNDWLHFPLHTLHLNHVRSPPHDSTRSVFLHIRFVGPAYAILDSIFCPAHSDA